MASITCMCIIDHIEEGCEHSQREVCEEALEDLFMENGFATQTLYEIVAEGVIGNPINMDSAEYLRAIRQIPKEKHQYLLEKVLRKAYLQWSDEWGCCVDCYVDTSDEYYMVQDSIWAEAGLNNDDGFLCIGCLETRIGRALTADDFIDALINDLDNDMSERMRNRLESSAAK